MSTQHTVIFSAPQGAANAALAIVGAVLFALLLASAHHLDAEPHSPATADAVAAAQAEQRLMLAANAMCASTHGPAAQAVWLADGAVRCVALER